MKVVFTSCTYTCTPQCCWNWLQSISHHIKYKILFWAEFCLKVGLIRFFCKISSTENPWWKMAFKPPSPSWHFKSCGFEWLRGGENPRLCKFMDFKKVLQYRFGLHFSLFIPNVLPILSKTQISPYCGMPSCKKGKRREGEDKTKTNTQIPKRLKQLESKSNGV